MYLSYQEERNIKSGLTAERSSGQWGDISDGRIYKGFQIRSLSALSYWNY